MNISPFGEQKFKTIKSQSKKKKKSKKITKRRR